MQLFHAHLNSHYDKYHTLKMIFRLSILRLLLCMFLLTSLYSQDISFIRSVPVSKHFDSENSVGGIQSWSFDQTSSGILYAANNSGLLEFDGNAWSLIPVPQCTKVRSVKVGNDDRIFVGGQGQIGYFSASRNGLAFTSLLDKLPRDYKEIAETWKILELNGKIYFNTESQLVVFEEDSVRVMGLPGYIYRAFIVDNTLQAQFNNVLYEYRDGEFQVVTGSEHIPGIISILPREGGIYYFTDKGQVFERSSSGVNGRIPAVNLGTTNTAIQLMSGDYCIGTQNNGLYILDQDLYLKHHFTKNEGLPGRTVLAVHEDQFANLWVATNNGIDYLEMSLPFSLVNENVGVEGTGYDAIQFGGEVFLGTNNGLFIQETVYQAHQENRFVLFPESNGQVYNLSRVGDDLIMGHHRGAFLISGRELINFHDMGSWKFMPTKIPELILGGDYQGINYFKKEGRGYMRTGRIEGFYESSRVMEYESDSVLWMTHGTKGAFRINFDDKMQVRGEIKQYGINNGFPSNDINVFSLNDQLVFTAEDGIYNFNRQNDAFSPNQFFNKWLGQEQVVVIASIGGNTIYYIQEGQFGKLIQESFGTFRVEKDLFKHINKFMNDDLPNVSIIDEQNILIGAKEGFILYNPVKAIYTEKDFSVLLRDLEVKQFQDSTVRFDPAFLENYELGKNSSLKFRFAATFFDGFEETQYAYRLIPLDEHWSAWSNSGEKEYSFLSPGEYTFEVKALNVYGKESSVTSFAFRVLKPWYASDLAIGGYLVGGIVLILLILILQQRKHRTETSMLNQDREKALMEKNEEINQISIKSKEKINTLMNEKLRSEIDLKNDQLTTITMHYMNSNEFIQDALKKIESNLDDGGSATEMRNIIKTIYRNLSDNDAWERFAYHFDQVHGGYLKKLADNNIKLSPREIKLAAFLRMNMSSKEISTMLNITERSVELARYRLRKKLKLSRDQNLVEYLIELDDH